MKKILILSLGLVLFSCNKKQQNDFDISTVKKHIEEANKTYGERFFKNDSTMYSKLYTKDAVVMPEFAETVKGRAEIFKYYYNEGKNEPITIDLNITEVYGSSDLVSEEGTYAIKSDKKEVLDQGKYIALWKKEDNTWKMHREIWNTNTPPH